MKRLIPLLLCLPLYANDTMINSGAHGPAPLGEFEGEESVIRMVQESIHIRFGKEESEVTCRFTFRSGKKEGDAKQTVGFPDFIDTETDTGSIREMQTFIDGRKVESKKQRGWFYADEFSTPKSGLGEPPAELPAESVTRADFYSVEGVFPAGKDVIIERRYVASNGGNTMNNTTFGYTTHTGAVWQGSIGKAEFRVTLDGGRPGLRGREAEAQAARAVRRVVRAEPGGVEGGVADRAGDDLEGLRAGGAQDAARDPAFDLDDAAESGVSLAQLPDASGKRSE